MRPRKTKSARIREFAAANPNAGPTAIAAALAAKGVRVSAGHVASALRVNGGKAKGRAAEPSFATILMVKRFADKHGLNRVKWALGALERLGL